MRTNLLSLLILLFGFSLTAQEVTVTEKIMSLGNKPAFSMQHEGGTSKLIGKAWESYMKKYGKAKRNKKANQWETMESNISLISQNPMNIYMLVDEGKEMAVSYFVFDNGSSFIDGDSELVESVKTFLTPLAFDVERMVEENILKGQEKELGSLEKDLKKLVKNNEGYHNDIKKAEEKIREAEENITKNLTDQDNKNVEIKNQNDLIQETKDRINNIGRGK